MQMRLNHYESNPAAYEIMMSLEKFASGSGIPHTLYELIKIRASQINGCAFCIDMHTKDLLGSGESLERVVLLSVWRDAPVYTEAERAVLELTECVTLLPQKGVPDEVYERVRAHFDEKQYMDLVMAINVINCWNRISLSTGMYPGCLITSRE